MIDTIRPADVAQWAQQCVQAGKAQPIVLDVREPWELDTAHIGPSAAYTVVHLPMASVPARLQELPLDTPIACLCHHGGRSAQVANFLNNQGFDLVVNIQGGIHVWSVEVDHSVPRY